MKEKKRFRQNEYKTKSKYKRVAYQSQVSQAPKNTAVD